MAYITYPQWLRPEVIPGLPIRWYSVMFLIAILSTYALFRYQVRRAKLLLTPDTILSLFFWTTLGLLIGSLVFGALLYDPKHAALVRPWLMFWPLDENGRFTGLGNMSYHGGFLGAAVAMIIFCRQKKLDLWKLSDLIVQALPLGYTFGRVGNFINGELYGRVTDTPIGILFPTAPALPIEQDWVDEIAKNTNIPVNEGEAMVNLPRHPSQLYEALFEGIVIWIVLWFFVRKRSPFKGFSVALYLVLYGFLRFVIEYFRQPDEGLGFIIKLGPRDNPNELFVSVLNLTMGQLLCLLMIVAGGVMILVFHYLDKKRPRAETFEIVESNESARAIGQKRPTKIKKADRKP